jgi:hypothetical protein
MFMPKLGQTERWVGDPDQFPLMALGDDHPSRVQCRNVLSGAQCQLLFECFERHGWAKAAHTGSSYWDGRYKGLIGGALGVARQARDREAAELGPRAGKAVAALPLPMGEVGPEGRVRGCARSGQGLIPLSRLSASRRADLPPPGSHFGHGVLTFHVPCLFRTGVGFRSDGDGTGQPAPRTQSPL